MKGHELNLKLLEGLSAILMQDIEPVDQIKLVSKQLEIDGQFLINVIDIMKKKPENFTAIIMEFLHTN
jgi:hypothetical protein